MELSKSQKRTFIFLSFLVVLLSALHFHGFSTSEWHSVLDHSKPTEILYGRVRGIRSDDWLLDIPLMFAQTVHKPAFPTINTNFGFGSNLTVPLNVPVLNSSFLFRPGNWGFLLGNDFGLSWLWWTKYLFLFTSIYLVLWILTSHSLYSALGSLVFLYAPHTQYWTLHNYEPVFHGAFAFAALMFLLNSSKKTSIYLAGAAFGWSSVSFVIDNIYPPFQVVTGLFFLCLTIALLLKERRNPFQGQLCSTRLFSLLLGFIIIAAGGLWFYSDTHEAINLIANTTYPGRRVSLGGTFALQMLFTQLAMSTAGIVKDWAQLGNYCEASNFYYFFPLLFLYFVLTYKKTDTKLKILFLFCFGYLFFQLIYTYIGFPAWLAHLTLMEKATVNRTQIGMGLAELCILILFLSHYNEKEVARHRKLLIGSSFIFILTVIMFFVGRVHVTHRSLLVVPILVYVLLNYLLFTPKYKTHFLVSFFLFSFIYTFHFNPIVRGGNEFLQNNPLGNKLREIDSQMNEKSNWVVYGNGWQAITVSNYFRILGINAMVGYFPQPQLELFKPFDEQGKSAAIYNQCAFIRFADAPTETASFSFDPGNGTIKVAPTSPAFEQLGVTHFMFTEGVPDSVKTNKSFKHIFSLDEKEVYALIRK